ncbi:MAG: O-antigen ligase family protein [Candidatus Omnitrophica bacterium]|nr:O-antigen ligase family protein [Candidatus Omnitrophota bacterium]
MRSLIEQNVKRIDNLIVLSLCVLIFGLPFSISIVEIAATAAIVLWLFKKIIIMHSLKVADTPLNIPISVYSLFVLISVFNSKFLMTSLTGFGLKAMEQFLIFIIMIDTVRTKKYLKAVVTAILLSCALMGADGLWQYFTGYDFLRHYPIWSSFNRITASFKFPNGLGGWLITVIPLCVSLAIFNTKEKIFRISGAFLSIILLACLVLNFTKGALVAIIPAFTFLVWNKGDTAKKVLLGALLILLFGMGLMTVVGGKDIIASYVARGWSAIHRLDLIKMCWKMFLDRPFFGHGINTFMSIFEEYSSGLTFSGISYAHNCYMQILAETGIFGLLSFLWMIGALFVSSVKNMVKKSEGLVRITQIGILGGLLAYLVHSLVEVNLYALQLAILFYYFLGLAMAVQNIRE